jgi:hypothetical protein
MRKYLLLFVLAAGFYLYSRIRRATELFVLQIDGGRVVSSRGRIPPRLLADVGDIVERSGVGRARVRGIVRAGRPVLLFEGELDPGTQQQMRNVVGQFSVVEIRGQRPRD